MTLGAGSGGWEGRSAGRLLLLTPGTRGSATCMEVQHIQTQLQGGAPPSHPRPSSRGRARLQHKQEPRRLAREPDPPLPGVNSSPAAARQEVDPPSGCPQGGAVNPGLTRGVGGTHGALPW